MLEHDTGKLFMKSGAARQGGIGGATMRVTSRNLRIREDRAKYLYNLDLNSAYYDPKSRSMRLNPLPNANPEDVPYAGDNYIRHGGDSTQLAKTQVYAWEAEKRGTEVHAQADPSQAELLRKQFEQKKGKLDNKKQNDILDKYGGEGHLNAPPKEMLLAQTENYVEYARDGRVIKGLEKAVTKSKYEEDVHQNGHTR
jgi:pre-mRNA-processing factor SLU7